jgi:hypothetical protein
MDVMKVTDRMTRVVRREMSVKAAIDWAFGVELAHLDFDAVGHEWDRPGCDTIWRLMQRRDLGCKIDGGGRSLPHDDAEIIASFVAALPESCGGKGMAIQIAELGRTGSVPDWMPDATPRCVPRAWRSTKHGSFAKTEVIGQVAWRYRGREVKRDVVICPVTYMPTASQIGAARRNYLAWWGALLHLQTDLANARLRTVIITQAMPCLAPWNTRG